VVSSVLHIDHDLDEEYPFEILDFTGNYSKVNLKAGDMVFYESAKCFHKRSVPLKGRYHANMFLHYRPLEWKLGREDAVGAIPPHWAEGSIEEQAQDGGGGLQKTVVTFSLPEGSDPVVMNWERHDDGQEQFVFRLAPGVSLSYHTHVGFSWVARRDDDNSVVGRWTMAAGLASGANRIVVQSGRRSAEL